MLKALERTILNGVGYAAQLAYDFMPAKTMEEVGHVIDDIRRMAFDDGNEASLQRLEAALTATRAAHAALVRGNASAASIQAVVTRAKMLEDLLRPVATERDVLAGSLAEEIGTPPQGWSLVGRHKSTVGYFVNSARRIAGRLLEDRETRDAALKMRAQIQIQKRLLRELHDKASPAHRTEIAARLAALTFAQAVAVPETAAPSSTSAANAAASAAPRAAPDAGEEICIE